VLFFFLRQSLTMARLTLLSCLNDGASPFFLLISNPPFFPSSSMSSPPLNDFSPELFYHFAPLWPCKSLFEHRVMHRQCRLPTTIIRSSLCPSFLFLRCREHTPLFFAEDPLRRAVIPSFVGDYWPGLPPSPSRGKLFSLEV